MRFALIGAGPIGINIARCALEKGCELVALVDVDPAKIGRRASEIVPEAPEDVFVAADLGALPETADLVFHATGSSLELLADQLNSCLAARLDVVSTCEELAFPWHEHPELAARLHAHARESGVRLLGTGINPGFVMDLLPLVLSAACWEVRAVSVTRILDASARRVPFQQKVGVGITVEAANDAIARGVFGHVGLPESAWMISDLLDLGGVRLEQAVEPVVSDETGMVGGLHQDGVLYAENGLPVVRMRIEMVAGVDDPHDRIDIDGEPPLSLVVPGGVPGDSGTAAIVVNSALRLGSSPTGLLCMADLPAPYSSRSLRSETTGA